MTGMRAIGTVLGTIWLILSVFIGAGNAYYNGRAKQRVPRDIPEASAAEYDRGYRSSYGADDEYYRERRRERDGVNIDTDSARPMVDLRPSS